MGRQEDVTAILARNLKDLMEEDEELKTQSAIARKSGVVQTSVGNMLHPTKRLPTKKGRLPSPTVENVDKVARAFGKEAWQLLHPDPAAAPLNADERARFERAMKSIKAIQDITDPGSKPPRLK